MDLARQKDAATGVANQVMEDARGLAYSKITTGLLDTDLGGDSRIVSCSGVYRFISCSAGTVKGSGEKIVYATSASATNPTQPLIPHIGTITKNGVAYTWSIYDSQDDSVTNAPYRLTVIVSWSAGRTTATKIVQVQSLFWSPAGCRSLNLHPFAAPCQAFFASSATMPAANLDIAGTVNGTAFTDGDLYTPDVQSSGQVEQVSQVQGSVTRSSVSVTSGGVTSTAGGTVAQTSAADNDPGSGGALYSRVRCPTDVSCNGGTVTSASGPGTTSLAFTAPGSESYETDSTTSASVTNVCPPPTAIAETDAQPCGGSRAQQGGPLTALLTMNGFIPALGTATVAQIQAAASPSTAFINRVAYGTSSLCTPISTVDGCLESSATRNFGTINIGGLPSGMSAPAGWSGAAWNGYFLSLVGYSDTASAAAGVSAPLPPRRSPEEPSTTGTGPATATSRRLRRAYQHRADAVDTQVIGGHTVLVSMSLVANSTSPASVSTAATQQRPATSRGPT